MRNISLLSLADFLNKHDVADRKGFITKMRLGVGEGAISPDGVELGRKDFVLSHPREALIFGAINWLHMLHLQEEMVGKERELVVWKERLNKSNAEMADRYRELRRIITAKEEKQE